MFPRRRRKILRLLMLLGGGGAASLPALGWDFTKVNSLPPGTTFTRATAATYFDDTGIMRNASSGVPRFNNRYSGGAWSPAGLLIEAARTNLMIRSEEFDTWTNGGTFITANQAAGLDGATTADKLKCATTADPAVYRSAAVTNALIYTWSVFARRDPASAQALDIKMVPQATASLCSVHFNLTGSGAANTLSGTPLAKGIERVGPDWYRCWVTIAATATGTGYHQVNLTDTDGTTITSPDADSGCFIWGAMLEQGDTMSSYVATAGSAVARNADVALVTLPLAISSPMSALAEWELTGLSPGNNNAIALDVGDGSTRDNFVDLLGRYFNGTIRWFSEGANTANGDIQPAASSAVSTIYKGAFAIAANDFSGSVNGAAVAQDTSVTAPTGMTTIGLGVTTAGNASWLNGHLRRFEIYRGRLSDGELRRRTA